MKSFLAAALLVLAAALPAAADDSGGISGYVRDGSGKPVPHASVRYQRMDDGTPIERRIETDGNGFFNDITLEPGRYTIFVERSPGASDYSCALNVFGGEVAYVLLGMTGDCSSAGSGLVDSGGTADVYRI
jgi:hypothetical protein